MTAQPGDLGIDFSRAIILPARAVKDGAKFIIRYSAGVGNGQSNVAPKLCKPGEIADAVAAGLDFFANSEWYESRITEGADAGLADGASDLTFWRSRGLERGAAIYVSWDADPVRSQWASADAYLKAYRQALDGYYKLGAYAGSPYLRRALRRGIIDFGWRPNAGSWSNDGLPYQPKTGTAAARTEFLTLALKATRAVIAQTGNYWYGHDADEDLILRSPHGSHLEAVAANTPVVVPPPIVPPSPNDGKPHPWQRIAWQRSVIDRKNALIARLRARLTRRK